MRCDWSKILLLIGCCCFINVVLCQEKGVYIRTKTSPPLYLASSKRNPNDLVFSSSEKEALIFDILKPSLDGQAGHVTLKLSGSEKYVIVSGIKFILSSKQTTSGFKRVASLRRGDGEGITSFYSTSQKRYMGNYRNAALAFTASGARANRELVSFEIVAAPGVEKPSETTDSSSESTERSSADLWTACSRSCGNGLQMKVQLCPNKAACEPILRNCNLRNCPKIQRGWSKCSKTCGGGFTTFRCRSFFCPGQNLRQPCNIHKCDTAKKVSQCTNHPCVHGRCTEIRGGFFCKCTFPYTGELCDEAPEKKNPCDSNPCKNGECSVEEAGYKCTCNEGFSGQNCDKELKDPCNPNPCQNGKCSASGSKFRCKCDKGYMGSKCERIKLTKCQKCEHGTCVENDIGQIICECEEGYTGKNCQKVKKFCKKGKCQNGGKCANVPGGFICTCRKGFTGKECESEISSDPCASNPCINEGTCRNTPEGDFLCMCPPAYTGKTCEEVSDPCTFNPCKNEGICRNTPEGDFICMCPPPYTGKTCEEVSDPCISKPCKNEGICRNTPEGDFVCMCPPPYTGKTCEEVADVCDSEPCKNGAQCLNVDGDYSCVCSPGYEGRDCGDVSDPCKSKPCKNGGQCQSKAGDYTCACSLGYEGKTCGDVVDNCDPNPCNNEATCENTPEGFQCICASGYTGTKCGEVINHCDPDPCVNSVKCRNSPAGFACVCNKGYEGKTCSNLIDYCADSPCGQGECLLEGSSFRCACYAGYKGDTCEEEIDFCNPNPCIQGTCTNLLTGYKCSCDDGYTGDNCDEMINYCDPNPCKNGVCKQELGGFKCDCGDLGLTGELCEEVDFCNPSPCKNGACRKKRAGGYECICDKGYAGKDCETETEIDPCDSSPCLNGGTCVSVYSKFWCFCKRGYKGDYCETREEFDVYSKCTKTCGGGSRYKVPRCDANDITKCPRVYVPCSQNSCSEAPCFGIPGMTYRYKTTTACCSKPPEKRACGHVGPVSTLRRIVGGIKAQHGQWPWAVLLHIASSPLSNSTCGATLIHKEWAVTAGHCMEGITENRITAILGTTNPLIQHLSTQIRKIKRIVMHEDYSFPTADIALIQFDSPVEIGDYVNPLCLPNGEVTGDDTLCHAAGWGVARVEDTITGIPSDDLMQVGLKKLNLKVCTSGYADTSTGQYIDSKMLCAGSITGIVDTCMGDSGGPLMCQRCNSCTWYLSGITSFGARHCGSAGRPGVYTDVVQYEKWIRSFVPLGEPTEKSGCTK